MRCVNSGRTLDCSLVGMRSAIVVDRVSSQPRGVTTDAGRSESDLDDVVEVWDIEIIR